ncbi:MAG TPA: FHA domain-containing protein [Candidatus Blautia faecigallinarum]|uniref:FHA domain-containing protein n=1 Tax=Candidatus Blautia faecigallinarum TaxID=2838488 RepID=A0A9D2ISD4_9FIRM|nr:FHA domain-containing protein [Candidatus Blautia faecigallinarum]
MGARKWMKFFSALLCTAGVLLAAAVVQADCDIEQISLHMPDVKIYYRSDTPETSYEAYLGGEALSYEDTAVFEETGEGVEYYLMLDISASIPDAQFENIKAGMLQFLEEKRQNDRIILLTFGNESKVVLNGSETPEAARETIQALTNEDMETVLFQSIVQAADMIDTAAQTEEKRRVIITITDGEDCVTGQATAAEAQNTLKDKGIPLYAFAVDVGKEEFINSFGEFARNTGGTLNIFSQGDSIELFRQIKSVIQKSCVARFHSATNVASNEREDLTVKFLTKKVRKTREVVPTRWYPDTEAPGIVKAEVLGEREIRLTFSESVLGADSQGNYKIEKEGETIPIGSVFYSEEESPSTVLTFEEPLYTGTYTLSFSNITDDSMEKNPLSEPCTIQTEGIEPVEEKSDLEKFLEKWWWLLILIALLIAAGIISTAVVFYRKIKKNKGVIYVDGKATLASNVDVKQHISTRDLPQKKIVLVIRDKVNGKCETNVTINGSLMVGRSGECDVYFDDERMSRQHFALETDGTDVYITDLESHNGTYVNGIRINKRRKLLSGDEIAAGNMEARILW